MLAGVADIRRVTKEAQERRALHNQRTILFVDEVHRWNKAQQDALLPWVENGTVILIGATTENPYFSVNRPLVSRSRIFQFRSLTDKDLRAIARNALADPEWGYGQLEVDLHDEALSHLVDVANGDARGVLNALELAVETTPPNEDGIIVVDMAVAEESIQRRAVLYDKDGDYHYDTISAFIKSLRGSDPDAALYWLAKMVYAGEDPRFIFRRMLIFAGEDVGMADPSALHVVMACADAFDRVGLPEGRFHLAEAVLYLATAPKSNSTLAFFDALTLVEQEREGEVPTHLKDGSRDKEGFGHGQGYLYPHAFREHWIAQQYLPDALQGRTFYKPSDQGYEQAHPRPGGPPSRGTTGGYGRGGKPTRGADLYRRGPSPRQMAAAHHRQRWGAIGTGARPGFGCCPGAAPPRCAGSQCRFGIADLGDLAAGARGRNLGSCPGPGGR